MAPWGRAVLLSVEKKSQHAKKALGASNKMRTLIAPIGPAQIPIFGLQSQNKQPDLAINWRCVCCRCLADAI